MWTLANLARNNALGLNIDPASQTAEKSRTEEQIRTMVRAVISLDGDIGMLDDALIAMKEITKHASDPFIDLFYDADFVKRLVDLLNRFYTLGPSHQFQTALIVRGLGDAIAQGREGKQVNALFQKNGLDKLNKIV